MAFHNFDDIIPDGQSITCYSVPVVVSMVGDNGFKKGWKRFILFLIGTLVKTMLSGRSLKLWWPPEDIEHKSLYNGKTMCCLDAGLMSFYRHYDCSWYVNQQKWGIEWCLSPVCAISSRDIYVKERYLAWPQQWTVLSDPEHTLASISDIHKKPRK